MCLTIQDPNMEQANVVKGYQGQQKQRYFPTLTMLIRGITPILTI